MRTSELTLCAMKLLARRDHSIYELKTKLKKKYAVNESQFQVVFDYLKKYGYLTKEEDLANRWARAWRAEGRGRHWIAGKLKTKGLPEIVLKDDHEEYETARDYMNKKLKRKVLKTLSFAEKSKMMSSLVARGFSQFTVSKVLAERGLD